MENRFAAKVPRPTALSRDGFLTPFVNPTPSGRSAARRPVVSPTEPARTARKRDVREAGFPGTEGPSATHPIRTARKFASSVTNLAPLRMTGLGAWIHPAAPRYAISFTAIFAANSFGMIPASVWRLWLATFRRRMTNAPRPSCWRAPSPLKYSTTLRRAACAPPTIRTTPAFAVTAASRDALEARTRVPRVWWTPTARMDPA